MIREIGIFWASESINLSQEHVEISCKKEYSSGLAGWPCTSACPIRSISCCSSGSSGRTFSSIGCGTWLDILSLCIWSGSCYLAWLLLRSPLYGTSLRAPFRRRCRYYRAGLLIRILRINQFILNFKTRLTQHGLHWKLTGYAVLGAVFNGMDTVSHALGWIMWYSKWTHQLFVQDVHGCSQYSTYRFWRQGYKRPKRNLPPFRSNHQRRTNTHQMRCRRKDRKQAFHIFWSNLWSILSARPRGQGTRSQWIQLMKRPRTLCPIVCRWPLGQEMM